MTCGIYKIENKLDGKVYIGQSIDIEKRWKQHCYLAKYNKNNKKLKSKLYLAIIENGIENFEFSIIEECFQNELENKEKYWIDYYNSIKEGYNIVYGSPLLNFGFRIINEEIYNDIVKDLVEDKITISEISKKYNLYDTYIYKLNSGEIGKKDYLIYPLRKSSCLLSKLEDEKINSIKKDLLENNLLIYQIAEKNNVSVETIRKINNGITYHDENINYPIKNTHKKLNEEQIKEIINLLKNSKKSIKEIGILYDKNPSIIGLINNGKTYHNNDLSYPIRKTKA